MLQEMRTGVFAVCLGLAWHVSADQARMPAATGEATPPPPNAAGSLEAGPAMNPNEPMQGGMKKPGMMKDDVRISAEKKAAQMDELLKKEAESMPPMPAQEH
jgi:hypothetical protein